MEKGKLLYRFNGGAQTEQVPEPVSVTTPRTNPGVSDGKDNTNSDTAPQDGGNISQPAVEFPRDKEGNIDYDQITDPYVYAAAVREEFGDDALEFGFK